MADRPERDVLAEALPDTEADWRPFWHRVDEPDGWVVSVYGDKLAEFVIGRLAASGWRLVPSAQQMGHIFRDINPEAACPSDGFPSWAHDPAQAVLYSARLAAQPSAEPDASREPGTCIHAAGCICRDPGHDQCCAAQPSAEPGLDVERLARAVQNADHGASFRTRQGAIVQWRFLSDQQKALALGDATAIARNYAALTPDRPTPGDKE